MRSSLIRGQGFSPGGNGRPGPVHARGASKAGGPEPQSLSRRLRIEAVGDRRDAFACGWGAGGSSKDGESGDACPSPQPRPFGPNRSVHARWAKVSAGGNQGVGYQIGRMLGGGRHRTSAKEMIRT